MSRETGSGKTPERVVEQLNKMLVNNSLNAISKATGIGISALHRYQKGIGEPTTATLSKLADYFGVSVPWLRGEDIKWKEMSFAGESVDVKCKDGRELSFSDHSLRAFAAEIVMLKLDAANNNELIAKIDEWWPSLLKWAEESHVETVEDESTIENTSK